MVGKAWERSWNRWSVSGGFRETNPMIRGSMKREGVWSYRVLV